MNISDNNLTSSQAQIIAHIQSCLKKMAKNLEVVLPSEFVAYLYGGKALSVIVQYSKSVDLQSRSDMLRALDSVDYAYFAIENSNNLGCPFIVKPKENGSYAYV